MEASPRNTAQDAEQDTAQEQQKQQRPQGLEGDRPGLDEDLLSLDGDPMAHDERPVSDGDPLISDGPEEPPGGVTADGPGPDEMSPGPEVEVELRPQRLLRIWQLAPIVVLAATGSLMFAFPLAFEFGDGGAVVAMLGLLICLVRRFYWG